jgi:hypothetical protein
MITVSISIGGEGEQVEIPVTVSGCSCRAEDFVMALVGFANDWKNGADSAVEPKRKPCGCKDA